MRPTKLTPEFVDSICDAFEQSANISIACKAHGISRATYYKWIDGRSRHHREFRRRVEEAQAKGKLRLLALINDKAITDWKAAAWILERTENYRKDSPIEETGRPAKTDTHPELDSPKKMFWAELLELREQKKNLSGSGQAYAAIQRAFMNTYEKYLSFSENSKEFEELDEMTDDQLIATIADYVGGLPVLIQNKLFDELNQKNTVNL